MPSISCVLCTARSDYPIIGLPDIHLFEPTIQSLAKQTFRDFELVLVDALHEQRKTHDFSKLPFIVKHVPIHPNHRFWLDRKRWFVCAALNTGIIHAEGELLVRIDDCSEFNEQFLQRFWDGYRSGFFPLAMHTRYRNGKQAYYDEEYRKNGYEFARERAEDQKVLEQFHERGKPVRDTRWPTVEARGGRMVGFPQWFYGYSSVSLDAALKLNGFNELFDGLKGQEDQEFGMRLGLAGYRDMFLLDVNHWVVEHEHESIPEDVVAGGVRPFKCNYGLYLLNERRGVWRANERSLTLAYCEWVRNSVCPSCGNYQRCLGEELGGRFYIDGDDFREWLKHQNTFDLREERMNL